jgi:hypothetical protein
MRVTGRGATQSHAHMRAILVGIVVTVTFVWLDFLAGFFLFEWAGGSYGGMGAVGKKGAAWWIPAWIAITIGFLALDVFLIRVARKR